nr:tetratricopeptide repeat protein [uncultured Allomuricauda sp.]
MRKLLLILTTLTFWAYEVSSQNQQKADSLRMELKTAKSDTTRLRLSENLFSQLLYSNPKEARKYVQNALILSKKLGRKNREVRAIYAIANFHFIKQQRDSAKIYYTKAKNLAKEIDDKQTLAKSLSSLALLENGKNGLERAIKMRDTANQILLEIKDYLNYAIGIGQRAQLFIDKGSYTIAYEESLKALRILDTIQREEFRDADLNIQIGNIECDRSNFEEAVGYFQKAIKIFKQLNDEIYESNAHIQLGNAYFNLKQSQKAIQEFELALDLAKKHNLKRNIESAYSNMGMQYIQDGEYSNAIAELQKALNIATKNNVKEQIMFNNMHLGRAYSHLGKHDIAFSFLDTAYELSKKYGGKRIEKEIYRAKANAFERAGLFKKAIKENKIYNALRDSLNNLDSENYIEELKTIYETEKKEAAIALQEEEIKTLNQEVEISNLKKGLYAGGMASALALSGLLVFGFRQRIKKNRIAREKQEEIYKQEIEHKKKELTSQTLHLVQKNTFIQELKENLENLKNSPEKFKMKFRRIVMLLKKQNASDKDWEVFKSYFSEVHNDFDQKLKTLYPEISEKEIRLAAFLRMNLTTKEIAATLNVLPDSILKSKYRLKKKLELDKETDLNSFLNSL